MRVVLFGGHLKTISEATERTDQLANVDSDFVFVTSHGVTRCINQQHVRANFMVNKLNKLMCKYSDAYMRYINTH